MIFPTDPNKRPELWNKFIEKLAAREILFIVRKGVALLEGRSNVADSTDQVVSSFRSADVVRFGSNRDQAIGPFFALDVQDTFAQLCEYAVDAGTQITSRQPMQEDLQSVAINLFFERKEVTTISIPFTFEQWDLSEWDAVEQNGKTLLKRKA